VSVSLSVSSVLCLSHSYALCSLHTCPNVCLSVLCPTHIFLFRLFCIHMLLYHTYSYVSNLSVTFIHTMSPMCVCLSLSPHLPLILRHYVGIACVQLCSSVLSHSCHILVSTLTVHINLLNCVVTHVSLIARPPGCLFVFCE